MLKYTTENIFTCLILLNNKWMPKKGPIWTGLLPVTPTQWEAQDKKIKLYFPNAKQNTYPWVIVYIHKIQDWGKKMEVLL